MLAQVGVQFRLRAAALRDLDALGMHVPAGTFCKALQGLVEALFAQLDKEVDKRQRQAAVARADETSWPVQFIEGQENGREPPPSGAKPRHWLWVCITADTTRTIMLPTRGLDSCKELLGPPREGAAVVVCDRLKTCIVLRDVLRGRVERAFCRAHMRRDFERDGKSRTQVQDWADGWLERIGEVSISTACTPRPGSRACRSTRGTVPSTLSSGGWPPPGRSSACSRPCSWPASTCIPGRSNISRPVPATASALQSGSTRGCPRSWTRTASANSAGIPSAGSRPRCAPATILPSFVIEAA